MQSEMLHFSVWQDSIKLIKKFLKFHAMEGRYYIIALSGLLTTKTIHSFLKNEFNFTDSTNYSTEEYYQNGGSMIMDPEGINVFEPLIGEENVLLTYIVKMYP